MKWLVKLLDLKGTDDNPAFSKIAWWALFIGCVATKNLNATTVSVLATMAFGRSVSMTYLSQKNNATNAKL